MFKIIARTMVAVFVSGFFMTAVARDLSGGAQEKSPAYEQFTNSEALFSLSHALLTEDEVIGSTEDKRTFCDGINHSIYYFSFGANMLRGDQDGKSPSEQWENMHSTLLNSEEVSLELTRFCDDQESQFPDLKQAQEAIPPLADDIGWLQSMTKGLPN